MFCPWVGAAMCAATVVRSRAHARVGAKGLAVGETAHECLTNQYRRAPYLDTAQLGKLLEHSSSCVRRDFL